MLKQLPTRNQRTKGFKVKYGFQIFLLITVGIWLLYQLKHSIDKKKEYEQSSAKTLEKLKFGHETPKLGRKGFQPWIKEPKDLIDDEKIKVRSGGGDDEIVGHDQDKMEEEESEEVEDLIDEEDKEREDESEEEESEDMGKQTEDISSLNDKRQDESENDAKEESEKSRALMRQTQSIGSEFEFEGLERSEKTEILKQQNTIMAPSELVVPRTDPSPKVVENVTIEHGSFQNVVLGRRKNDVLDFSDSEAASNSNSLRKMEMVEPRAFHNLTWMLVEATGSFQGTTANENEKTSDNGIGKEDNLPRAQDQ